MYIYIYIYIYDSSPSVFMSPYVLSVPSRDCGPFSKVKETERYMSVRRLRAHK